jgi:hypothetical protein
MQANENSERSKVVVKAVHSRGNSQQVKAPDFGVEGSGTGSPMGSIRRRVCGRNIPVFRPLHPEIEAAPRRDDYCAARRTHSAC